MKVVAFNGSARKDGNTALLIKHVFDEYCRECFSIGAFANMCYQPCQYVDIKHGNLIHITDEPGSPSYYIKKIQHDI